MGKYYLAVDIGASSGRHILAELRDGQMILQEVHRLSLIHISEPTRRS